MDKRLELLSRLSYSNNKKILLIIIDGLGGLPHPKYDHKTELQYANLPNLDEFVKERETVTGLIYPVRRGIIPGSGVGHLGLFGYDPLFEEYKVGRGALEAADLNLGEAVQGDIIARFNFCTIDNENRIIDRRAGRLSDCTKLANLLNENIKIKDINFKFIPTKEHRGILIIKNGKLSPHITDTDPQKNGSPILKAEATLVFMSGMKKEPPTAATTANIVNDITKQALNILKDMKPANGIIFRGFSKFPDLPNFNQVYSLNAAAIAVYPLYRGIAKLVGMTVLNGATDLKSEINTLKNNYEKFNFFFLHYKDPDTKGEDGDFEGKVKALEDFDRLFPEIRQMSFDVLAITGDHSTPSVIGRHSHHSVPVAINSNFMKGFDRTEHFDEKECINGSLGRLKGVELMTILLANAEKLYKFEGFV
jgi:2,3-bisphosphoglycerate-independent phosphoglycerate mutase